MTGQIKIKVEKDNQNIISENVDSDVKVSTDTPTNNDKNNDNNNNSNDEKSNPTKTNTNKSSSTNNRKDKPKAFTIKYKRPRGSRACTVCRSRKVRCDAEIHIPCTNCITFGCDCILPEVKKRGNQSGESKAKKQKTASNSKTPSTTINNANTTGKSAASTSTSTATKSSVKEKNYTKKKSSSTNTSDNGTLPVSENSSNISSTTATATAAATNNDNNNNNNNNPITTTASALSSLSKSTINNSTSTTSANEPILNISQISVPPSLTSTYKNRPSMHKKELLDSKAKTSLTFLGSSSIGVVPQRAGENHVELTTDIFDTMDVTLDSVELEILKIRGAFLLPNKELSLDLINAYFEHVHPLMPVINRSLFMKKFHDPNDNPSLMVLHAVLLLGCRVSKNPLLLDSRGTNDLASITFFRRAKALYETNYESDPISIIQTLILIGSYWDGPEDVTKNSFYWTRVAVGLAQGFGFQRDVSKSQNLTISEKKIWRRIWWCLFEKDRNVSIAFGRPVVIDLNDCDVPMLTIDDFDETDAELGIIDPYTVDETQALYFIHLVKLAEITGIIIKHQYSVKSESMKRRNAFSIIEHCDMLMGIWFTNLPPQLSFSLADNSTQNFYACLLNAQYYNRLYLIHRSNLVRMARSSSTNPNNYKYPSWGISFQSARMISIISKILLDRDLLQYVPVMFIYIAFSALIMLIYHVDSTNGVIASTATDSLYVSRAVLKELQKAWPIAGVLLKLFDKYANDKLKRSKLIESSSKVADYKETVANEKLKNSSTSPLASDTYGRVKATPEVTTYQEPPPPHHHHQQQQQQQQPLPPQPRQGSSQLPLPQTKQQQGYGSVPHEDNFRKNIFSPGSNSTTSGISPGGNVYQDYQTSPANVSHALRQLQDQQQQQQQQQSQQQSQSHYQQQDFVYNNNGNTNIQHNLRPPQIEELVKQYKLPMKRAAQGETSDASDKPTTDTSPTSSTKSFPEISMVTDNLTNKQDFIDNFEPTQLFPNFSIPPTRVQSPTPNYDEQSNNNNNNNNNNHDNGIGSNIYGSMNQEMTMRDAPPSQSQEQFHGGNGNGNGNNDHHFNGGNNGGNGNTRDPHTPGFQTNFIDSAFNYLNLQSGIDMNEDIHSLFHMMN
ncbi:transcriptional regulatory protein, putative [Candida dubliniensis CD36]|uniref:Transcriptional regulatory protein, putative n=1 Tax=Candida dubliniensis (strain CD36 / ATCC MYA-646 / CBS 7987 / NCPF 3949 / NRRL Y-17841) TaxID=573826 RepID=B9WAN0_CANDC|nr:transcriptional regulatory protein, putative [Candida dubliniensis CD36]CAX43450.1 transcriptional regulatory protein, putative [Candida dubliniensis CD36]